tara:strand:- start:151 stop:675 length:525 start_codon:yes stop_codon:yes gene_type:complete
MPTLAITGSPAVGKTSVSEVLRNLGWDVVSVSQLAEDFDCVGDYDEVMDSREIDIHRLSELFECESNKKVIIDGHLSHFLAVDGIVVLRCQPDILRQRLTVRNYSSAKINSNVEWELVAGTWAEIIEFEIDQPILELDGGQLTPEQIANAITQWVKEGLPSTELPASIDWLENT